MRGFSLFNAVFLAGLLVAVRVMVAGVERGMQGGHSIVRTRWAMLGGAMTLAGFAGSLCTRLGVSAPGIWLSALLCAAAGALGARWMVRRAAAMPVSDHEFDPRFELQGVPATVVEPIPAGGEGLVRLPTGLARGDAAIRARSLDGAAIPSGSEVGVERIEEGVAFVEAWAAIESRL